MNKLVIALFIFSFSTCYCQDTESFARQELSELHLRTRFVRDSVKKLIDIKNQEIKDSKNESDKIDLAIAIDSLWNISDRNDVEELKINIDYCKKNPACAYSFGLVNLEVARQSGKNFYADFEYIIMNASKEIKESESGLRMVEKLKYFKQSMVGSLAPHFSGIDINGQKLSLDNFRNNKYLIIDFWASWCAPCREEIPFLNSLREKYKSDGLEIISISSDQDLTKWKNAIIKDKTLEWKHFSVVQNNSTVQKDYFVNGIPHKVLIDKQGKIIGKWKSSGEFNKRELQRQLTDIFKY